ncbi:MAG: hypothetical protein LQ350_001076 [Teloschistes chrysophthalmus]|nr:MAG: hypothetical protein LQ350_001076 [Niorma chrysophthalma]
MPSDDLKAYATSTTDFYDLLGITFESSQRDLDRQWRKTALKYHPDKVGNDPIAKEKFHLAQIGYDLLSDPTTKALYDNTRNARLQRKRQSELFEGKRRQMKDDLEAREKGVKRAREEEVGEEEALERELRRLAEDGKRRRKEREDALRKDLEQDAQTQTDPSTFSPGNGIPNGTSSVSELDRTIKIRWPISSADESISTLSEKDIATLFSTFGKIESVTMLKPKPRLGKKKKKHLAAVCMVQYSSIVGAHAAVEDFPTKQGEEWTKFDSVTWAADKEPDFLSSSTSSAAASPATPTTRSPNPASFLFDNRNGDSRPGTPTPAGAANGNNAPRKMPSFSSFSPAAFGTPKGSPLGKGWMGANSPSLEEMTMIRLKNAEKKRLAEELARQDERDDGAAGEGEVGTSV